MKSRRGTTVPVPQGGVTLRDISQRADGEKELMLRAGEGACTAVPVPAAVREVEARGGGREIRLDWIGLD